MCSTKSNNTLPLFELGACTLSAEIVKIMLDTPIVLHQYFDHHRLGTWCWNSIQEANVQRAVAEGRSVFSFHSISVAQSIPIEIVIATVPSRTQSNVITHEEFQCALNHSDFGADSGYMDYLAGG